VPHSENGVFPNAEEVDADWLSQQLQANGIDATVCAFTAEPVGTGQIGKCYRYHLNYAGPTQGPATLIAKFPSDDPASRATGVILRNFLKEVKFYQSLQSRLTIRTPKCYFAEIEGQGPEFLVLMEDLSPGKQGNQLLGCNRQVAQAAVNQLIGLHVPSWCDESLKSQAWLYDAQSAKTDALFEMYKAQLPGFLDRFGPKLAKDERNIIARLGESHTAPLYSDLPDMFSLVHVDYRLDNLMIDHRQAGPNITVVDWQSITLGAPLSDVAYFIGAGLLADARRDAEEGIVHGYHEGLLAAGIEDFDWSTCWNAYRRGAFAGFGVTVIASMMVARTERGDKMFTAMAQRHARHALDLGADEFLA